MNLLATPLPGVWLVEELPHHDERGYFERTYCRQALAERQIAFEPVQASVSYNRRRGTVRGMHFQAEPHQEQKLVTCLRGAVYDVALDLRPGSATFGRWYAVELREGTGRSLFIPEGCAHGFQTIEDDTLIAYQISTYHCQPVAQGVRWDDPRFGIRWPLPPSAISDRDRSFPDYHG